MYSRTLTPKSTAAFSDRTDRLRQALAAADAVVVGAGAGLSASAGFSYQGARFRRHFSDFAARYDIRDMYSGGFYPFPELEEFWAYWSRYVWINRYQNPPEPVYDTLLALLRGREYFVLTTNVDHCFQKAGFDKERLFYTQGDYGLFQCSEPCCRETWDNEAAIREMVRQQKDMRIPKELLPRCPRCGRPAAMNLRADARFVEDAGWHAAAERCEAFLRRHQRGQVLYWELGVGFNTPGIIKYPFWQRTAENPEALYACVNAGQAVCPPELAERSLCLDGDIGTVLRDLASGDARPRDKCV